MATLTIDEPTASELVQQAEARGVSVEQHVRDLAALAAARLPEPPRPDLAAEARRWLAELKSGEPVAASLPVDFQRAELYDDAD